MTSIKDFQELAELRDLLRLYAASFCQNYSDQEVLIRRTLEIARRDVKSELLVANRRILFKIMYYAVQNDLMKC